MKKYKSLLLTAGILFLLLIVALAALMAGSYPISPTEVVDTFLGKGTALQEFTIYQIRLPRVVLAVVVASALSISGGILLGITRNPLSEPGMIGINAGAALFVVLWISSGTSTYYSALSTTTVLFLPAIAVSGSLLSAIFIYLFSYKRGIRPVRFILTGIGMNSGINAIITFYQLNMSKGDYNQVLTWTNGSLWGSSFHYILLTLPPVLILILITLFRSRTLDVLSLGDELSAGVGVSIQKELVFFLVIAALLAALATAVAGNIAFLGLLGPQIARRITGPIHRKMLPLAAVVSSVILILADTAARNLFSPVEIPVGIIVSVFGVPYFIYLMIKEK